MGTAEAIRTGLVRSFQFSGRATNPEFWWFAFFCLLIGLLATGLDYWLFTAKTFSGASGELLGLQSGQPLGKLWAVVSSLSLLAAAFRRMNDTGGSKMFLIFAVLLAIGGVFLTVTDYFGLSGTTGGVIVAGNMPLPSLVWRSFALAAAVPLVIPVVGAWWLSRPSQTSTR
jgi:uncharacterized membrane protein YhaH (DUF805 family)